LSRGRTFSELQSRGHTDLNERTPTIAVWGHFHGRNLGDELVVATIIDAIQRRRPSAHIFAVSLAPADTCARYGVPAYPLNPGIESAGFATEVEQSLTRTTTAIRRLTRRVPAARNLVGLLRWVFQEARFAASSYGVVRRADVLVVAGSGQLLDKWGGAWRHPYAVFRWVMLARLARVRVVFPSVGAGPIKRRTAAFFIRSALRLAAFVSVRDGHSRRVLEGIGARRPLPYCPDMAFGCPESLLTVERPPRDSGAPAVIGLNVMAHEDPRYWPNGVQERYEAYLRKLAAFATVLLDEGHIVRLFSSQTRSDAAVADDFLQLVGSSVGDSKSRLQSVVLEIDDVGDLISVIAGCDYVVAGRYHSVLLPLLLDIPVIALAYDPKTTELMADVEQTDVCLDIDAFQDVDLVAAWHRLRQRGSAEQERLRACVATQRSRVAAQFDELLDEHASI
jgi:polysaccharide pyruvyl transferase WcaK-like protein